MCPINKQNENVSSVIRQVFSLLILVFLINIIICPAASAAELMDSSPGDQASITGPPQPAEGPGGADYSHAQVIRSNFGTGDLQYYLFEPGSPTPASAPLIIFMHGFGLTDPTLTVAYGGWIDHIVKKGNIVVYPTYQSRSTPFDSFTTNAVSAVLDAISELQKAGHVSPDLDKVAVVGHSCGGVLAPSVAAVAAEYGLPVPKAVMTISPGLTPFIPLEDVSKIPPDTLLLAIAGDHDYIAGDKDAKKIFRLTTQIPPENKDYIVFLTDEYGSTPLIAHHGIPCGPSIYMQNSALAPDAHDFFGIWKLFDALTDAAFYGKNREYALGNTSQQRYLGEWSDGTPIKELLVTDHPYLLRY